MTVTNGVYGASAQVTVFGPDDAPPYKSIAPRELNRNTDLSTLTILTPPEAEWKQSGERLAALLNAKWGIQAQVAVSDSESVGDGWAGQTLVLGNLGNNPHIARLYGLYLAYTDAVHPGPGGISFRRSSIRSAGAATPSFSVPVISRGCSSARIG
ncbi:hypothetical protein N6H14_13940 [Paenibacillus sp. CC-CFT747]|nr:hypothetical protein N6H14_13940 [Paenibacillus sp. CC-CFT747]